MHSNVFNIQHSGESPRVVANKYSKQRSDPQVYAYPAENDPRDKLEDFIRNPEFKIIAGLRTDGLQILIDLVTGEIKRQEPDFCIIFVDMESSATTESIFQGYGEVLLQGIVDGGKVNFLFCNDIPIVNWQSTMLKCRGRNVQVYCLSVVCK